jgi:protein-S-isoprenylcysteine O-methyltransferase Ste14
MGTRLAQELDGDALRVPLHPALLFGMALGLGLGLQGVVALPPFSERFSLRLAGGAGCAALGFSLGAWALRSLRRAGQAADFGVAVSVLVQEGAYRFSRNPLYVALLLVYCSFALSLASGWLLAVFPLLAVALDRLVVVREERFLTRRFSGAFADYRQRVRRWL